ncbi:MAG: type II toxin-antitoxin system Phd/YefM family antitoxin [Thermodesulfobacteriota bacterium]|jgi:prevent-host-death family protein
MEASIIDLRYKMKAVLDALERREEVTITYHGKVKGVLVPAQPAPRARKIKEHPFFGMTRDDQRPVEEVMRELRAGRYDAL